MAKSCLPVKGAKACVKVDPDVLKDVSDRSWHMHQGYPATTVGSGKEAYKLYLHRLVAKAEPGAIIDHANGDKLDARRENLRVATKSQNSANVGKLSTNKSGLKGVSKKGEKYRAFIHKGGRTKYLGSFDDPKEAACKYDKEAKKLFGDFAKLNGLKCPR